MRMALLANISKISFYLNACLASNNTQMTSVSVSYVPYDVPFTRFAFNIEENGSSYLKSSNSDNYHKLDMSIHQVNNFMSTLLSTISKAIKTINSIKNYAKEDGGKCKPDIDSAISNWMNHTFEPSKSVDIKLFKELKAYLKNSIMPSYDELKSVVLNNEYEDFLPLFESYALLEKEFLLLENYFRKHPNITANEAHKLFLSAIRNSYKKSYKVLTNLKKKFNQFQLNFDDFYIYVNKIFFLLKCERKVNEKSVERTLKNRDRMVSTPNKDFFLVSSSIKDNLNLEQEIYSEVEKIRKMKESRFFNTLFRVLDEELQLYFLNFEYEAPSRFMGIKTSTFRDHFYFSDKNGMFSIRRVDADPMNVYSNEVVFRDYNSEFTSRTVMIFYEINHKTKKEYHWIVSTAFNSPKSRELIFVKSSDFFSKISNFKEYFNYYLSGLKFFHSEQISGVVPRIGNHFISMGLSLNDLPFDFKYSKIGSSGFTNRIIIDYKIFMYTLDSLSKNIEDKDSNELKCFIKEISEKAYKYALEHGIAIKVLDDSSEWFFNCFYHSLRSQLSN